MIFNKSILHPTAVTTTNARTVDVSDYADQGWGVSIHYVCTGHGAMSVVASEARSGLAPLTYNFDCAYMNGEYRDGWQVDPHPPYGDLVFPLLNQGTPIYAKCINIESLTVGGHVVFDV